MPLRPHEGTDLAFLSTVTTFGTAVDITAAELSSETFVPADRHTADVLRSVVEPGLPAPLGPPAGPSA